MRERTEQINFRATKNEKATIRCKARRCGMATGEYIRNCALDRKVIEMPREGLKLAYIKVGKIKRYLEEFSDTKEEVETLKSVQDILLKLARGEEVSDDGGDEDLAG